MRGPGAVGLEVKPAVLYYHAQKDKWRIAKSLSEKGSWPLISNLFGRRAGDFAHVKDTAELPWEIRKCWKAFDGQRHQEVKLQLEQVFEMKRRRQEDMDELPLGALSNLPEAFEVTKGPFELKRMRPRVTQHTRR